MEKIKKEALYYLGYKNAPADGKTNFLIDECIDEIISQKSEKYIYRIFDVENSDRLKLINTSLKIDSNDLKNHLKSSKKVAIICATLGAQVDFLINKYNKTDLSKAVAFDACATAIIEDVCDRAQDEIYKIAKKDNLKITPRFSPGYGDFDIKYQKEIIKITNADKFINLTATDESVLIPTKSVTAFVGLTNEDITSCANKCLKCNMKDNCKFRREMQA